MCFGSAHYYCCGGGGGYISIDYHHLSHTHFHPICRPTCQHPASEFSPFYIYIIPILRVLEPCPKESASALTPFVFRFRFRNNPIRMNTFLLFFTQRVAPFSLPTCLLTTEGKLGIVSRFFCFCFV